MAQTTLGTSQATEHIGEAQVFLDRAASLGLPASVSARRLRTRCQQLLGQGNPPEAPEKNESRTAMDEFLLGEQHRLQSAAAPGGRKEQSQMLEDAVAHYRKALEQEPRHYWAHFQLGRCLLALGRGGPAIEAISTCTGLRPDCPWGYSTRGLALALLGRFDESRHDLDRAVALAPDFRPARLNRAVANWLAGKERSDEALADLGAVLQPPAEKVLVEAAFYRACILLERHDPTGALIDLDAALAQRPDFPVARLLRAQVRITRGDSTTALADLDAYLSQENLSETALPPLAQRRGHLLCRLIPQWPVASRPAAARLAVDELTQAAQASPRSATLHADLGAALEHLGQAGPAVEAYTRSLTLAPSADVLRLRGWAHEKLNHLEQARDDFAQAATLDPADAEAHAGLAYLEARLGNNPQSHCSAARALVTGIKDYLALHNVACVYASLSKSDPRNEAQYQDLAMAVLQHAVQLFKSAPGGPDELSLIRQDPALACLRNRPDYRKLVGQDR